jgi:hypothetical protein
MFTIVHTVATSTYSIVIHYKPTNTTHVLQQHFVVSLTGVIKIDSEPTPKTQARVSIRNDEGNMYEIPIGGRLLEGDYL